jgi:hypothetical protein
MSDTVLGILKIHNFSETGSLSEKLRILNIPYMLDNVQHIICITNRPLSHIFTDSLIFSFISLIMLIVANNQCTLIDFKFITQGTKNYSNSLVYQIRLP